MKKRSAPYMWSDDDDDSGSDSDNSSTGDGENEDKKQKNANKSNDSSKIKPSQAKKKRELDFQALAKHGYKGGPSVLDVPIPEEEEKQDWSWSKGEDNRSKETEETYEDRLKTRAALQEGEQLANVVTSRERRELSFQQKEKRKRDLGQASRGKNYVEEEKRLLRESGIYSGFDS